MFLNYLLEEDFWLHDYLLVAQKQELMTYNSSDFFIEAP